MAATKKVTVSIPRDLADALSDYVSGSNGTGNVSAFVSTAVREKLDRENVLARLHDLWGDLDPDLIATAAASLSRGNGPRPS